MSNLVRKLLVPSLGVGLLAMVASCSSPVAPNQTEEAKEQPTEEGSQSLLVPSRHGEQAPTGLAFVAFADGFLQRA